MAHFEKLTNFQNIETISNLFSRYQHLDQEEHPFFIVLIGSPGVGKTTTARNILNGLHMNYDNFYNVSLDTLVEKVKPYRSVTRNAYQHMKQGKNKLNNKNYIQLSTIYTSFIYAKQPNFKANQTRRRVINGIKNNGKNSATNLKSLDTLLWEGLNHGVQNGWNILYDTTVSKTGNKIKKEVMDLLDKNRKYTLIVIHITADEEQIKEQLSKRHLRMIEENYIRAIPPKLVGKFLLENKEGYDVTKHYFETGAYLEKYPDTLEGFLFLEYDNTL